MSNKVVIITGASRGIGVGITELFFEKGYRVVVNYRSDGESAENLKARLQASDDQMLLVQADVGVSADREKLLQATLDHFGQVDVLVNNAGISARGNFLKGTEEEYDAVMATNLKGPIFLAQACAKWMIDHEVKGSIINIASVSGHIPNAPTSYSASKAGILMATKTMALKLGEHGIRANSVTPGTVKSDMNRRVWEEDPSRWADIEAQMPIKRTGEPRELAQAVYFLASDENSYITGVDINVDGGWMLKPFW